MEGSTELKSDNLTIMGTSKFTPSGRRESFSSFCLKISAVSLVMGYLVFLKNAATVRNIIVRGYLGKNTSPVTGLMILGYQTLLFFLDVYISGSLLGSRALVSRILEITGYSLLASSLTISRLPTLGPTWYTYLIVIIYNTTYYLVAPELLLAILGRVYDVIIDEGYAALQNDIPEEHRGLTRLSFKNTVLLVRNTLITLATFMFTLINYNFKPLLAEAIYNLIESRPGSTGNTFRFRLGTVVMDNFFYLGSLLLIAYIFLKTPYYDEYEGKKMNEIQESGPLERSATAPYHWLRAALNPSSFTNHGLIVVLSSILMYYHNLYTALYDVIVFVNMGGQAGGGLASGGRISIYSLIGSYKKAGRQGIRSSLLEIPISLAVIGFNYILTDIFDGLGLDNANVPLTIAGGYFLLITLVRANYYFPIISFIKVNQVAIIRYLNNLVRKTYVMSIVKGAVTASVRDLYDPLDRLSQIGLRSVQPFLAGCSIRSLFLAQVFTLGIWMGLFGYYIYLSEPILKDRERKANLNDTQSPN